LAPAFRVQPPLATISPEKYKNTIHAGIKHFRKITPSLNASNKDSTLDAAGRADCLSMNPAFTASPTGYWTGLSNRP